jgi:hypothetical protein
MVFGRLLLHTAPVGLEAAIVDNATNIQAQKAVFLSTYSKYIIVSAKTGLVLFASRSMDSILDVVCAPATAALVICKIDAGHVSFDFKPCASIGHS